MKVIKEKNALIITDAEHFNAEQILDSGQVFRYFVNEKGNYVVYSGSRRAEIIEHGNMVRIEGDPGYFYNYFDLSTDYGKIINALVKDVKLAGPVEFGRGIRMLRQDPYETIISFIISSNNNIPRIKGIIERICSALGEDMGGYRAFPTAEKMAAKDKGFYTEMGAGYRADYIAATARDIAGGFPLSVDGMDVLEARKHIMKLKGVGPKVADCILLFAFGRMDVFPVDTWMEKLYLSECGRCASISLMSAYLSEKYAPYAGYAQQYLYYYMRKNSLSRI